MEIGETRKLHFKDIDTPGEITYLGIDESGLLIFKQIHPLEDDFIIEYIGHGFFLDQCQVSPQEKIGWSALTIEDKQLFMFWETATIHKEGNPVTLEYKYEGERKSARLWLDHLELGSMAQAHEMLTHLPKFENLLHFKQAQHGGRRKGSRSKKTIMLYDRIMRGWSRYRGLSDTEFIHIYNSHQHDSEESITQAQLSRAKTWAKDGKPGLDET